MFSTLNIQSKPFKQPDGCSYQILDSVSRYEMGEIIQKELESNGMMSKSLRKVFDDVETIYKITYPNGNIGYVDKVYGSDDEVEVVDSLLIGSIELSDNAIVSITKNSLLIGNFYFEGKVKVSDHSYIVNSESLDVCKLSFCKVTDHVTILGDNIISYNVSRGARIYSDVHIPCEIVGNLGNCFIFDVFNCEMVFNGTCQIYVYKTVCNEYYMTICGKAHRIYDIDGAVSILVNNAVRGYNSIIYFLGDVGLPKSNGKPDPKLLSHLDYSGMVMDLVEIQDDRILMRNGDVERVYNSSGVLISENGVYVGAHAPKKDLVPVERLGDGNLSDMYMEYVTQMYGHTISKHTNKLSDLKLRIYPHDEEVTREEISPRLFSFVLTNILRSGVRDKIITIYDMSTGFEYVISSELYVHRMCDFISDGFEDDKYGYFSDMLGAHQRLLCCKPVDVVQISVMSMDFDFIKMYRDIANMSFKPF